jgi:hypothetical protein|nr:MAG TPA: hypothetical protein [Caudoviricetes sp.]
MSTKLKAVLFELLKLLFDGIIVGLTVVVMMKVFGV